MGDQCRPCNRHNSQNNNEFAAYKVRKGNNKKPNIHVPLRTNADPGGVLKFDEDGLGDSWVEIPKEEEVKTLDQQKQPNESQLIRSKSESVNKSK